MICRHCKKDGPRNRPRGLCCHCYYSVPGVREKYPSQSKFAVQGTGHKGEGLPPPTDALPGTEGKVRALTDRAKHGLMLWNPLDA